MTDTIEPTDVTRTMRCPRCGATATHTIRPALAGEAVACPTCAEKGHRVACVEAIDPTEEQKQAAYSWCHAKWVGHLERDLARLLAEREHKLRGDLDYYKAGLTAYRANLDAARARIAELEGLANTAMDNRDAHKNYAIELEEREAAHLAHIKALREACSGAQDALDSQFKLGVDAAVVCQKAINATAHYDVEGGEG